ncbi:uncharacterized protein MELLADRAFT_84306 [Melampsora larici-populina 98AG31]|uniref:Uncharacterized protein n=1 Tax=Melampsora larici-populina (strain 98AG31 / pathotype 3-4-7) TaxID=747676 RepID=F4RF97_MELLP|nr:uncharacterized protein MELLADRAFT_84306 [Melampsora larici-populina 98AG31]EGG08973.1 hypothetical protein MELLADRAFT_84306 [Melampsora larici-populina 98AG31]
MTSGTALEQAMKQAAQRAAQLTWTRSRSVALGQLPGPPLATPQRNTNGEDELDGVPLEDNELEELMDDTAMVLQGPLIGSNNDDGVSWRPSADKGKERALSPTSPTPSREGDQYTDRFSEPETQDPHVGGGRRENASKIPLRGGVHSKNPMGERGTQETIFPAANQSLNDRVDQLHADGRYSEAKALQAYIENQSAESTRGENGERIPAAGGSGLPNVRPYTLVAEELSSNTESSVTVPLAGQIRQEVVAQPRPTHLNPLPARTQNHALYSTHIAPGPTQTSRPAPKFTSAPLGPTGLAPPLYQHHEAPLRAQPAPVYAPAQTITMSCKLPTQRRFEETPYVNRSELIPQLTQEDIDEAEQVKVLMAAKKGWMVLRNGDVVENGRLLVADTTEEMEKGLPQLSPVLTHWLKTFKSYIPLTAFDKYFLMDDQTEWSRRKAPTESEIDDGSASLRVYGGQPPPDELTMQFEEWIDCIGLYIKYVEEAGWQTLSERFAGHKNVVIGLRDDFGWMVSLRYCVRIRLGVMLETIDNRIRNFSKLQTAIFEAARIQADTQHERAYRTNPYAGGGPLAHLNPSSGLPKSSTLASTAKKTTYDTVYQKAVTTTPSYSQPSTQGTWIPLAQWRTMSTEQRQVAMMGREGRLNYRRWEDDCGRYKESYRECDRNGGREHYRRDDRSKYRRRSSLRSRSPRGSKGKGRNNRQ